ncbi:MAG: PAS domain-containing protein [Candidatus Hadarchaeota archaeon]
MSKDEMETMLDALPVDITFVDSEDTVRYFNETKHKIFSRLKSIIGTKVQDCHPKKSLHVVNKILNDFKSGRKDTFDFWVDMKGRKMYIRYFAVRDAAGKYLGCLEVTQDITEIQKIEGEKRLLDDPQAHEKT